MHTILGRLVVSLLFLSVAQLHAAADLEEFSDEGEPLDEIDRHGGL